MEVKTLIEFIDAACDTKFVQGPYEERGGIMLVAYPGSFKTTILRLGMESHPDAMVVSDLNVQQWIKIRDDFVTARYTALGFTDYEKIYQRHQSTSAHIEGIIKGLVAEGYGTTPNGDNRMPVIPAHALVIGAMTNACMERKYDEWQKDGFLRRFLWITFTVENQSKISEAIRQWKKLDFGRIGTRPANRQITVNITPKRSAQLEGMMRDQPGFNGPGYVLLKKIVAVLEWRKEVNGQGQKEITALLENLAPGLTKNGGKIKL